MWSKSFLPRVRQDTQVLILGSMPGRASLEKQQYYAHSRNVFWPIMATLFEFDPALPYEEKLEVLNNNKVGLWDVYAQCYREGSLDASIVTDTAEYNDFPQLFLQYPGIHTVFFNGQTANKVFRQKILPSINAEHITFYCLPSTSPAHAGMTWQSKLDVWRVVKESIHEA